MRTVRIGTRRSPLAMRQVEEVVGLIKAHHPEFRFEIVGIDTCGDKDKKTPISDMEGTDFFTREIEEALLKDEIDFAVHSAKDLSDIIPDGLRIAAIIESIDPYDALVSRDNLMMDELPIGARVGASSQRRKTQLKAYRDDFQIVDIRGNIEERLDAVRSGNEPYGCMARSPTAPLDAIIVAACALIRLGLEDRIAQRLPFEILKPHPLQGALAIEVREDNKEIIDLVKRSLRGGRRDSSSVIASSDEVGAKQSRRRARNRLRNPKKEIASPLPPSPRLRRTGRGSQ